jgi:PIN domain nuclease of toxin-antitoxin system
MKYLFDTHTLLWYLDNDKLLSTKAQKIISDLNSECYISYASFFEMSIKANIKKLVLKNSIEDYKNGLLENGFILLPISSTHLDYYINLPVFENHKDPFDRLLISTAAVENLTVLSIDEKFKNYQNIVKTIW